MSPPSPPCYAVIFVSKQSAQKDGYEETAEHMLELAKRQPGFLDVLSVRGENGTGITISYWTDEKAIKAWKDQPEHQQARWQGRTKWYEGYSVQIVKVERAYSL